MVVSVIVGLMLLAAKRYCEELYPGMAVWGYEDLALASFGSIGKVPSNLGGYGTCVFYHC